MRVQIPLRAPNFRTPQTQRTFRQRRTSRRLENPSRQYLMRVQIPLGVGSAGLRMRRGWAMLWGGAWYSRGSRNGQTSPGAQDGG